MLKVAKLLAAGAVLAGAAVMPAVAADIYEPPVIEYIPPEPAPSYGGWYIRGHIGMSNQNYKGLDYFRYHDPAYNITWLDKGGFASAPLFGGGVGYQVNNWLRGDVTVEYRGKASFSALDRYELVANPAVWGTNHITAKKSEWLLLANAYADVGDFHGLKPYIGAGIGASRNTISHFNDTNVNNAGGGYADPGSTWQFAWALHAGVGMKVTERMTLDLGYSFVNLGPGKTGQAHNYNPALTAPNDGFTFKNLYSHDIKLGVRYALN